MKKILIVITALLMAANAGNTQSLSKFLKGANKVLETLNEMTEEPQKTPQQEKNSTENQKQATLQQEEATDKYVTIADVNTNQFANIPYLTDETVFIDKDVNEHMLSDVNEGIFSLMEYNREIGYLGYYSFYTIEGDYLFPPMWESPGKEVPRFDNGAAVVKYPRKLNSNQQLAIIYADGSVRELSVTWDEVTQFYDGIAMVREMAPRQKPQIFYINTKGEKILPHLTHTYEMKGPMDVHGRMRYLKENRRAYFSYKDQKWGYLDKNGKIVITPQFQEVRDFSNGYALAIVRGENSRDKAVFIDKSGKIITDIPTTATTLYYAEPVSDVDSGVFCIRSYNATVYYNLEGKEVAQYPEGTPFHNGYAFVKNDSKRTSPISIVDSQFNVKKTIGFDNIILNSEKAEFNELSLTTFSKSLVFTDDGNLILHNNPQADGKILDFSDDGYSKVLDKFTVGSKEDTYWGYLTPQGEAKILFAKTDTIKQRKAKGPKDLTKATYDIVVKASPEEGGTASGSGKYEYGDTVYISASANEGWLIAGTDASNSSMNTQHPAKYVVRSDGEITVYFSEIENPQAPDSQALEGTVTLTDVAGNRMVEFPLYLETNAEGNYKSPYGDRTFGVLAPMLDPEKVLTNQLTREGKAVEGSKVAYNCFYVPLKVAGTMEANGKKYLAVDGGQISVRNMTILSTDKTQINSLNTLMANLMIQFEGMGSIEVPPYSYRIEMLDIDSATGEFTFGNMECFSPKYGWLSSDDSRLFKFHKSLFIIGFTKPLHSDMFKGIRMKKAAKRDDILWYPPESYDKSETGFIESLGKQYREFVSDKEMLKNLNLMDLTKAADENIFKKF